MQKSVADKNDSYAREAESEAIHKPDTDLECADPPVAVSVHAHDPDHRGDTAPQLGAPAVDPRMVQDSVPSYS